MKKMQGIAYIEVLIASAILTATLIPSYGYFANLMQSQISGENYIIARNLIETQIELERSKSVDQLVEGRQTANTDKLRSGKVISNLININPAQPSLYRFEIQINWQEPGGQRNVNAATFINPEGY